MKHYEVIAQCLVFGINDGSNGKKEHILKQGDTVELPENNVATIAMLSRNQIREVAAEKQPTKSNSNPAATGTKTK